MGSKYALIPLNGKHFPSLYLQFGRQLTIGRDVTCDLRIDSPEMSRRHAIVTNEDTKWIITDLESTNGLCVNDRPVIAFIPYYLTNGDKISFGSSGLSKVIYRFIDDFDGRLQSRQKTPKRKKLCDKSERQLSAKRLANELQQLCDSDLSCPICRQLFICAVSLNCSHTFCESCIEQWKHSNDTKHNDSDDSEDSEEYMTRSVKSNAHCCPVCRQLIVSQNRVLVLDNTIDSIVQKSSPKQLEHRKQLIAERKQNSYVNLFIYYILLIILYSLYHINYNL